MRAGLADLVSERNANAQPQSNIPAAMFGFIGLEPGTMLFRLSLSSHQPRKAPPPNSAAAVAAMWAKTRLRIRARSGRSILFLHLRRLVQQQPIHAYLEHGGGEPFKVHRLNDVAVNSQLITLHHVVLFLRRGKNHYRDGFGSRIALDALQHFEPIYFRKF